MLTTEQRQGLHGEGFVFALASSAGLVVSRPSLDVEGVDWMISYPGPGGRVRYPKIEVQVKTSRSADHANGHWVHRLRSPHFNALAGQGLALPRYLVLVIVPEDAAEFATCRPHAMELARAAYWASLADQDLLPAGVTSATVQVPQSNLLTPRSLVALVSSQSPQVPVPRRRRIAPVRRNRD